MDEVELAENFKKIVTTAKELGLEKVELKHYIDVVFEGSSELKENEVDIGVYTTYETLVHKIGLIGIEVFAYWKITNPPKDKVVRRVYFACDGNWKGYFVCYPEIKAGKTELTLSEWHQIDPDEFPRTSFQGFTYDVPEED